MDIGNINSAIRNRRIRITDHADEEAVEDSLAFEGIYFSVMHGEIIEDYPEDKPYPSCLIFEKNPLRNLFIASGPIVQIIDGRC